MKKIISIILLLSISLFADFNSIDYKDIATKLGKDTVIIDIRTPHEWAETGTIPRSKKIMFFDERGGYNIQKWMEEFSKYVKDKNQPFVLVCRTANRTKMVGNFLNKQGYQNVYDLKGGITYGYIKQGYKTEGKTSKKPVFKSVM